MTTKHFLILCYLLTYRRFLFRKQGVIYSGDMHLAGLCLWHLVFGDTLCFTIGCDIIFVFYPFSYRPKNRKTQYRDYNLNFRYENTLAYEASPDVYDKCVKFNRTIVEICLRNPNSNNCTSTIELCDAEGSGLHFS